MNTHADKIFECRYFLTPAECNPQGRMPITLLINRLIEVATLHANAIGIGYDTLVDRHGTWVWAVLNTDTRAVADISRMEWVRELIPQKECPVEKAARPRPLAEFTSHPYRFTYCDIDFNRHVNSSRYIELLLNQWSLGFHDANRLTRFEIAYLHEAVYDDVVDVRLHTEPDGTVRAELDLDGRPLCRALMRYSPR